ncbi:MAG: hypothetical protein ACFN06_05920 [Limosilactobacillus oris]
MAEAHEPLGVPAVRDVVFEGLGWVTVPAGVTVAAWVPKGVAALVRKAMI